MLILQMRIEFDKITTTYENEFNETVHLPDLVLSVDHITTLIQNTRRKGCRMLLLTCNQEATLHTVHNIPCSFSILFAHFRNRLSLPANISVIE